jgi:hypothetical protein
MELRYHCPECRTENRKATAEASTVLACEHCEYAGILPLDWTRDQRVRRCPICGGEEIFRQRDFSQRLASIVFILGLLAAPVTRYMSLVIATLLTLTIYLTARESLTCYRCRAHVRGHWPSHDHGRYDPAVDERVRQSRDRSPDPENSPWP